MAAASASRSASGTPGASCRENHSAAAAAEVWPPCWAIVPGPKASGTGPSSRGSCTGHDESPRYDEDVPIDTATRPGR